MIVLKDSQDKVLAALQAVSGIVERRHTLPILANVLVRKQGKQVELTTSDLEIQVRTTVEFEGDDGDFSTTIGARKLIDILRSMPSDQTVSLTSNQNKMTLQGGKSRFTLQTLPADDFPLVQEAADFGPAFSVPQKTLKSLLGQVSFAMAVHDIRYYLNGILFVAEGKQLSLVATDGHRLAFASATLDVEVFAGNPEATPDDRLRFLDRLTERGIAAPSKAAVLAGILGRSLDAKGGLSVAKNWYVKLRFAGEELADAKAYLALMPRPFLRKDAAAGRADLGQA